METILNFLGDGDLLWGAIMLCFLVFWSIPSFIKHMRGTKNELDDVHEGFYKNF